MIKVRLFLLMLLSSGAIGVLADNIRLPDLGDSSAVVFPPHEERKMGENFMRRARRSLVFVHDPEINRYIQTLGNRMVKNSDNPDQRFTFFVIADPSINAFAIPGGFVGIHTGLILAAQTEGELAAVLAHETAHITQRHIPRLLAAQKRINTPSMFALLAAILLGGSGKDISGAIAITTAVSAEKQLNFSRSFEEEADRIGIVTLARSGYDPRAMPSFFERMQRANRYNDGGLPEFLRSHPVTTRRISESRDRAVRYPKRVAQNQVMFQHIRAKIRAQLSKQDPRKTVRVFADNLRNKRYRHLNAERYGYALALMRARQFKQARKQIGGLYARNPKFTPYLIARAQIEINAGQYQQGLAYYLQAARLHPAHYPILHNYAAALIKTGRSKQARTLINKILATSDSHPDLYKMLATAAGKTGDLYGAHKALAEYYYKSGYPKVAIQQLEIARRHAKNNFYALSAVEARIQEIKAELAFDKKIGKAAESKVKFSSKY